MFINQSSQKMNMGLIWIHCLKDILNYGKWVTDENVSLLELKNYYVTISTVDEEDEILQKYANKERIALMKEKYTSCSVLPGYKLSYGKLLFDNKGINQIEWVINKLKIKPETKSATIVMHTPGEKELSCLSLLDFKLRDNQLDITVVYRSQNVFASQPGNFIILERIFTYVANQLNVKLGVIEGVILSAHIYEQDIKLVEALLEDYDTSHLGGKSEKI